MNFRLFAPPLHIIISSRTVRVIDLESGKSVEIPSEVSVHTDASGRKCLAQSTIEAETVKPFNHRRIWFDDFESGHLLLHQAISTLKRSLPWSLLNGEVLLQITEKIAGGLSVVEERAALEMVEGMSRRTKIIASADVITKAEALKLLGN